MTEADTLSMRCGAQVRAELTEAQCKAPAGRMTLRDLSPGEADPRGARTTISARSSKAASAW
jgi:hypothetical protein